MPDILFKCGKCANYLTCDVADVDKTHPCSGCGQSVRVPKPDIAFRCEECQANLCAPRNIAGEALPCPRCGSDVTIPQRTASQLAVRKPSAMPSGISSGRPGNATDATAEEAPRPSGRQCPKCGGSIAPAAIICIHCGLNLLTGRKPGQRASPTASSISHFLGAVGIPLLFVCLAAGGWYYWDYRKNEEVRVQTEQQHAAEAARAEKLRLEKTQAEQVKEQKRKEELAKAEQQQKEKETQRKANIEHCRILYCDTAKVTLFDTLTLLAEEREPRLSIDPAAIETLAHVRIEASALSSLTDINALAELLGTHHLIIRKCPVSENGSNAVALVTTESIWAYGMAAHFLKKHQPDHACQVLTETVLDNTRYGLHCQNLRSLLASLKQTHEERAALASQLQENISQSLTALKISHSSTRAAQMHVQLGAGVGTSGEDTSLLFAEQQHEKALANLRATGNLLEQFGKLISRENQIIFTRHLASKNDQLYTESLALLDLLSDNCATLRHLCEDGEKVGQATGDTLDALAATLATGVGSKSLHFQLTAFQGQLTDARAKLSSITAAAKTIGDFPDALLDQQRVLRERTRFSQECVAAAFPQKNDTPDLAAGLKSANEAFASDCGNLMAHAAAGYFRVRWQARTAHDVFLSGSVKNSEWHEDLAREFQERQKTEMLRTAMGFAGRSNSTLRLDGSEAKPGSAIGLCVWNAKGALLPLSARLAPVSASTAPAPATDTCWGQEESLVRNKLAAMPITFGDYGYKDMYACMSAIEVYKWLCVLTTNRVPGLHIEFQDLELGKAGDSAGLTMAIAADSLVAGKKIRPDVAMTGSFRSDGSVQPVSGIFEKVDGAINAPQIEIVLLPKGNEADGLLLSVDKLCRIAIVSCDDIQSCFTYATDPGNNSASLATLRKAQVLILGGQWERAESLLVEVVADCPEIYTARRLLELIAFWKNNHLARLTYSGNTPIPVAAPSPADAKPAVRPPSEPRESAPPPTAAETATPATASKPAPPTLKKSTTAGQSGGIRRLGQ